MAKTTGEKLARPYARILLDIEGQIQRSDLRPGDILPTRDELAQQYHVARATVDRALGELARRGLIDSRSGRRTVVLDKAAKNDAETTIGVIWNWPEDQEKHGTEYLDLLFRGIREACAEFMLEVHFRSAPLHTWKELIDGKGAQGLLIVRPDYADATVVEAIHAAGVPVVLVPGVLEETPVPSISADNLGGIEMAIEHLFDLGHRDIGLVCLTATVPDHFERLKAFLEATGRRKMTVDPAWILIDHERAPSLFRQRVDAWLTDDRYPTAIISCDFMMTLSLLGRLRELGLRVPEDVSIVSFDDPAVAAQMAPALTTISQPIPRLGYRAIERLRELISGLPAPRVDRLNTALVVRNSTTGPSR